MQILQHPFTHFLMALVLLYIMIIIYRIGYVMNVRELVYSKDQELYNKLPGFFKMTWVQIFKYDYLKEILGEDYNDSEYLMDR